MLERVLHLREERRFVEEIRCDQRSETGDKMVPGDRRDLSQYRLRNFLSDHGGRLQHFLLTLRKAVDSRGENRLDRSREREILHWTSQPIAPPSASEASILREGLRRLLDEERIAACPVPDRDSKAAER